MAEAEQPRLDPPAGLTADRNEDKYLLPAARARAFTRNLAVLLPPQRSAGGRIWAEQRVTTVYLDTDARDLYRAAVSTPAHVKVRARAYRDARSGRPARGSGVDLAPTNRSLVFVELKIREGQRSRKRRACVQQGEVARFFEQLEIAPDARDLGPEDRRELDAIGVELRRMRAQLGRLSASCVVSYRRIAFEQPGAQLRITLDRELCAFAPPAALWSSAAPPAHEGAGRPPLEERACIVEVKSRGPLPAWLDPLLVRHDAIAVEYSKFVAASRAVHGPIR